MGEDRANSSNEVEGGKRCAERRGAGGDVARRRHRGVAMSWGGVGTGTRENREGLKSSRDAPREETLKMTQFITITATKGREGEREGARRGEK